MFRRLEPRLPSDLEPAVGEAGRDRWSWPAVLIVLFVCLFVSDRVSGCLPKPHCAHVILLGRTLGERVEKHMVREDFPAL